MPVFSQAPSKAPSLDVKQPGTEQKRSKGVYFVGTSHIAGESVKKVKAAIKERQPDCVAVELDVNRYYAMLYRQRGEVKLPFMQKMIITLMQKMQDNLSKQTNIFPGQEMLSAVEFANINGIKVAFIDQDINITVSRLMSKTRFLERLKLILYLIPAVVGVPIKLFKSLEFDLNKVPDKELIARALLELKKEFPSIYNALIEERNRYMARNIRQLQENFRTIVVVVGAGHVDGIKKLLKEK